MKTLRKILAPLASLRLTVTLLAASMFLVLAGTLAQVDFDIYQVQQTYFHSWGTWVPIQSFFPRPDAAGKLSRVPAILHWLNVHIPHWNIPVGVDLLRPIHAVLEKGIPFLGGYTLIVLLLVNLLSAHSVRFKFNWKRSGVLLIHFGLILLLVGELLTSQIKHEGQMVLGVGETTNFAQDPNLIELAVVDRSPADHDDVVTVPGERLKKGQTIADGQLPFEVRVDDFWPNSDVKGPAQAGDKYDPHATAGAGTQLTVEAQPIYTGAADAEKQNMPSAYLTFFSGETNLGTYLVSEFFDGSQEVRVDGKSYWIQLRPKRYYKPYTITLLDCAHDNYIGSDTPRNFSSDVRVVDPSQHVDRTVKIWMNHPLRFDGDVLYQQAMPDEKTSVLQVVKNPSSSLPYVACAIGALGLLIHFGMALVTFLRRRRAELDQKAKAEAVDAIESGGYTLEPRSMLTAANVVAVGVAAIALCWLSTVAVQAWRPRPAPNQFDYVNFGRIPVTYDGRTMPLDSLARNSLRIISGIEEVHDGARTISADELLAYVMSGRDEKWVRSLPIFQIDHPDIKSMLGLDPKERRFSLVEIFKKITPDQLEAQARQIDSLPDNQRDAYQQNLLEFARHLILFGHLVQWEGNANQRTDGLYIIAPLEPGQQWQTMGQLTNGFTEPDTSNVSAMWLHAIVQHAHDGDAAEFNSSVADYLGLLRRELPGTMQKVDYESFLNRFEPFYQCMILYVAVFVLAALSWLLWPGLGRSVIALLIVTLLLHTFGLGSRIYLMGRPPVTNLYSSAVFIGWGMVVLALVMELIFRDGVAMAVASGVGFCTLFIAHNLAINPALSPTGDTMEMMRAVLDTNLWLATHVVCITLGYSTTFLAGEFATFYVVRGLLDKDFDADARKSLSRKIYGTLCFAMFFSFVGTILGGIWADQSWGRFWGWDPKENGAILVVLWNALILHARWSGIARQRGVALLAIFGNIVTAWSWFGTNLLGVGLHSYGFMSGAATWLVIFMLSQVSLIAVGLIPTKYWRSSAAAKPVASG